MKNKDFYKEEILFKKAKIQGLNRVAIPKELLENLNLKEGDSIFLYYDLKKKSINLRKDE